MASSNQILSTILLLCAVFAVKAVPWEGVSKPINDTHWFDYHYQYLNYTQAHAKEINVLFLGDSITFGWLNVGKPIYQEKFVPLGVANYGIGGDRVENVLWRITNGEIDGIDPKVVVLMIGINNHGDSQDDIVKGIQVLSGELVARLPNSKIILLGILPCRNTESWFVRVADINIKISKLANDRVHFLDMFDQFCSAWQVIDDELFNSDRLHLDAPGYKMWGDTMDQLFTQLFNSF